MVSRYTTNLQKVAFSFAESMGLKISKEAINRNLEINPYYPSLLSLSEVFSNLGVENYAYRIDTADLHKLKQPFIALVKMPDVGSDFTLIEQLSEDVVKYRYGGRKYALMSRSEFDGRYQGVAWVGTVSKELEKDRDLSTYGGYKKYLNRKVGAFLFFLAFFLLAVGGIISRQNIVAVSILIAPQIVGLLITVLILLYEIGESDSFVGRICAGSDVNSCKRILSGNASKIWGVSWGEIGLGYFLTRFLFTLYPSVSLELKIAANSFLSVLTLPYIFFSLYYQAIVAKQWCNLCLSIICVVLVDFAGSYHLYWNDIYVYTVKLTDMMAMGISASISILMLMLLVPYLKEYNYLKPYEPAYHRLKYNPAVFEQLMKEQSHAPDNFKRLGISLGNLDGARSIVKVCNPFCGPCGKAHPKIDELLDNDPQLKINIVFTGSSSKSVDGKKAVRHLLSLSIEKENTEFREILDNWYFEGYKAVDDFIAKYPLKNDHSSWVDSQIHEMDIWCTKAEISYTPTIFLHGKRMPEEYYIDEIKYVYKDVRL